MSTPPSLPVPVPTIAQPMGPISFGEPSKGATSAPVSDAFVAGPTKPRIVVEKETPPEATPAEVKPVEVPIPQRMGAVRDSLKKKYPKSIITIRLDVTDHGPGMEYIAYLSGPDLPTSHRATLTGTFGKYQTLRDLEVAVADECSGEVKV